MVEDRLAVALVVREIPGGGGLRDATSAYGYPGALPEAASRSTRRRSTGRAAGSCRSFLRDAMGRPPSLLGARRLRSEVHVADPREPLELRSTHARHVRRNQRLGYATAEESGPEARAAFERVYSQTMVRAEASERYLYSDAYFERVLSSERALLLLTARATVGRPRRGRSSPRATACCTTSSAARRTSCSSTRPSRARWRAMIDAGPRSRLPLNLGGGVRTGDALDHFKRASRTRWSRSTRRS